MTNLEWCIRKLTEVALDLREPLTGTDPEHQAAKIEEVIERLKTGRLNAVRAPEATTQDGPRPVHGSGTGNQ